MANPNPAPSQMDMNNMHLLLKKSRIHAWLMVGIHCKGYAYM